jgi:antitoxin component of MazEF toxin-antitoxin module
MITKIVPIGNSKGIRIPNHILKQMNISDHLDLSIDETNENIILKPVHKVRDGWSESFKKMKKKGDDELIIDDSLDLEDCDW